MVQKNARTKKKRRLPIGTKWYLPAYMDTEGDLHKGAMTLDTGYDDRVLTKLESISTSHHLGWWGDFQRVQ